MAFNISSFIPDFLEKAFFTAEKEVKQPEVYGPPAPEVYGPPAPTIQKP